jgi:hypothetical protein
MSLLLEKFQSLEVKSLDLISESDRLFIAKTEDEYHKLLDNLNQWKEVLEKYGVSIPGSDYCRLVKDDFGLPCVERDTKKGKVSAYAWYESSMFSNAFGLKYINLEFEYARYKRNDVLIEYFKRKYHLSFISDSSHIHELQTPERVLEYIFHMVGSSSLADAGLQQLFKSLSAYFNDGILTGTKISFKEVFLSERLESSLYSSDSYGAKKLLYALSYFENGRHEVLPSLKSFFDSLQVGVKCMYQGDKFKGMKYYKNRKCELHFLDATTARDFFNLFRLN